MRAPAVFASFAALVSFASAPAAADARAWARPLTLSAGVGYATPAGTVAAEVEWLPMPILALAGAVGTDGSHTHGAAALRLQIPSDSIAIGIGLGGAIDALTLQGPEATTELHLAWRDDDGLALRFYAGFAHPVGQGKSELDADGIATTPATERRAYAGASLGWSF